MLGSVSVDEARDLGLRGASCADAEAKLDREAQLFHLWRCAAVVSNRCSSNLSRTMGLRTQGKHERKLCTNDVEHGSVGGFRSIGAATNIYCGLNLYIKQIFIH